MNHQSSHDQRQGLRRTIRAAILIWTLILGSSLAWNLWVQDDAVMEATKDQARSQASQGALVEHWAQLMSERGTERVENHPSWGLPGADYLRLRGLPSYPRQLASQARLVSNQPLNPTNRPRGWEVDAMAHLLKGDGEYSQVLSLDGQNTLCLMHALESGSQCSFCHAGEFLGAVSITVPYAQTQLLFWRAAFSLGLMHLVIWLAGAGLAWGGYRHLDRLLTSNIQAMEALALSEEQAAKIIQSSPAWVWVSTLEDGRFLEINDAFLEDTGYARHDIIGHTSRELALWPQPELRQQVVEALETRGEIHGLEVPMRTSTGTILWTLLAAQSIDLGHERLMVAVCLDITQRKSTEEALRDSREKYRVLCEEIPVSILSFNAQGRVDFVNRWHSLVFMGGHRDQEFYKGKRLEELPELDLGGLEKELEHILDGQEVVMEGVARPHAMPGEPRHVTLRGVPLVQNGKVTGGILILEDVTSRLAAEEERRRLAVAVDQSNEAMVITDPRGAVLYANPAFTTFTGQSGVWALGRPMPDILFADPSQREARASLAEALEQGLAWDGQVIHRVERQKPQEWEITVSPLTDRKGVMTNYLCGLREVTQERQLQRQLRQAQKMEAIGTLAGGIAHDFNNMLMAIMGFCELALDELTMGHATDCRDNLEEVLRASGRARDLVLQILTFSRRGEQEPKPMRADLIISEALKLMRATLPANIEIVRENRGGELVVLADPTQIHQVIMNLCSNAAHAMRAHGGTLKVSLSRQTLDELNPHGLPVGSYLKMSVSDTGHGMPPQVAERIFEPFFTTKRAGEGTGMGLSVVHGIVVGHGGAIELDTSPGHGATFHILLPLARGVASRPPREPESPRGHGQQIMFVEDDGSLAELNARILRQLGYQVSTMTDPLEALEVFQRDPGAWDLVITDLSMPAMDGMELSAKLLDSRPDMPILVYTGFFGQDLQKEADRLGIKEVLAKPLRKNLLGIAVARALY